MNMDEEKPMKRLLAEGWRVFTIRAGREQLAKNSGNEMVVFTIEDDISGNPDEIYCILAKGKRWTLKTILSACGIERNSDGNYKWTIEGLIGKKVLGLVAHEPNEYINKENKTVKGMQHRIVDFKTYIEPPPSDKEQHNGKDIAWEE